MFNYLKVLAHTSSFPLFALIMGVSLMAGWALWNLLVLVPGMMVIAVVIICALYPIWRWLRRS